MKDVTKTNYTNNWGLDIARRDNDGPNRTQLLSTEDGCMSRGFYNHVCRAVHRWLLDASACDVIRSFDCPRNRHGSHG